MKKKFKLLERTLFHGTVADHKDSIVKHGLSGDLGDFVKDSYGTSFNTDELEGITFAAQKDDMDNAVGAIRYHVGKKLDKYLTDVSIEDMKQHGMLVILKDIEPSQWDDGWQRRPEHGKEKYYQEFPHSVEPGDWFIKGGAGVDAVLTGEKMISFLRNNNALSGVIEDDKRRLIKYAIKRHGSDKREQIVAWVKDLSESDLRKHLRKYEDNLDKL